LKNGQSNIKVKITIDNESSFMLLSTKHYLFRAKFFLPKVKFASLKKKEIQ